VEPDDVRFSQGPLTGIERKDPEDQFQQ